MTRPTSAVRPSPVVEPSPLHRTFAQWASAYGLTRTELAVLELLSRGLSPAAIALERKTTLGTVRSQLKAIFDKTGFRSQQAVRVALLRGAGAMR